jgi:hypothetical protein
MYWNQMYTFKIRIWNIETQHYMFFYYVSIFINCILLYEQQDETPEFT